MPTLNATHDSKLRSWVESSNDPATDFPVQNLPWCTFAAGEGKPPVPGVAIGDRVFDLAALHAAKMLDGVEGVAFAPGFQVNDIAQLSGAARGGLRARLVDLFRADTRTLQDSPALLAAARFFVKDVTFSLPCKIRNYTDFYASIHHAGTVGAMFRPDNPLLPNYKHVPIGYHGRASSLIAGGVDVRRPSGQQAPPEDAPAKGPTFGPCKMLDYELEVGCVIARGNALGIPIPVSAAREHVLGLCLVNDWSARDLQKWEYQPLGPFLAKNFATTVAPFVVSLEALEPFRCPGWPRGEGDPSPLPYLSDEQDHAEGGIDITLEVHLQSQNMKAAGAAPMKISSGKGFKEMYWTFAQMIAHHTSNGCNLQPGDLLASGTVSGPEATARGCMLELTWDGAGKPRKPITLPTGETRNFLGDGDEVIIKGYCEKAGFRRVGFGECRGKIVGALGAG